MTFLRTPRSVYLLRRLNYDFTAKFNYKTIMTGKDKILIYTVCHITLMLFS